MDSSSPNTPQDAEENIVEAPASTPPETHEAHEPINEHDAQDAERARRFQDGEILRFVRVRFPGNNRPFSFWIGDEDYHYGEKVVAVSERGMAVGFVNSFPFQLKFHKGLLPVRTIVRKARAEDVFSDESTFRQERRIRDIVERLIEKNQLDMQITQVELTQMGKKAIFQFTAPTRVDFRGLVHEIVSELKMRIELRQISVRDRAAAVGGLGPCGRELCCSSFLAKYGNVGIKLAKNQDLSLNSSKINGVCGQLKCCLTYEDEVYQEKRKKMPRENALVKTKDGNKGKVIRLHILSEQFETISPEGTIRRYVAEMWDGLAEGLEIPKFFENGVTDNSKTVIGLDQITAQAAQEHEQAIKAAKASAKNYADSIFEQLFGSKTLDWALPELAEPQSSSSRKIIAPEEEEEVVYVAPLEDTLEDEDDEDEGDDSTEDFVTQDSESEDDLADDVSSPVPAQASAPDRHREARTHSSPEQRGAGPRQQNSEGRDGGRRRRRGGRGGRGGHRGGQRSPQS